MAPVDVELGGLPDNHEVRTNSFVLDQRVGGDAVAPLLHVAEVVERPVAKQIELDQGGDGVDHGRRRALLVARSASEDDAVLSLPLEWIPGPLGAIADAHRVDVTVEEQRAVPAPGPAEDIAHAIESNIVESEAAHPLGACLADRTDLGIVAGNADQIPQEVDHVSGVPIYVGVDGLKGALVNHCFSDTLPAPPAFSRRGDVMCGSLESGGVTRNATAGGSRLGQE